MSQEPEDVKPKLNLNIAFDGTRESLWHLRWFSSALWRALSGLLTFVFRALRDVDIKL